MFLRLCKKALTVTVPAAEVDNKVTEPVQQAAKTMRLPGLQPGRVPMPVVKKRFGDAIRQEVLGDVLQEKYYAAITQEGKRLSANRKDGFF